jgi:nucleotide-binding universal stress UspA family protein
MFETIVVGTDGSETGTVAVRRAAELARLSGGTLHIVSAHPPASARTHEAKLRDLPDEYRWSITADSELNSTLQAALVVANELGAKAETVGHVGDPVDVILAAAEGLGADVIVIGSRGTERRILGSVPNSITREALCDVLVVHTA